MVTQFRGGTCCVRCARAVDWEGGDVEVEGGEKRQRAESQVAIEWPFSDMGAYRAEVGRQTWSLLISMRECDMRSSV